MSKNNLVIGGRYTSKFDSRNDIYLLDGVFGKYADMENKRTGRKQWVRVDDLIPHVRKTVKSYLTSNKDNK